MGKTQIEWTDQSWPVINGCRRISPGCEGCYAERLTATRLAHTAKYSGLAVFGERGPRWTGEARLWLPDLDMPMKLRKPSRIFVADMGDLFFESVPDDAIAAVVAVMCAARRHTFQVLTKRPKRLLNWIAWAQSRCASRFFGPAVAEIAARWFDDAVRLHASEPGVAAQFSAARELMYRAANQAAGVTWPPPNVWWGVSAESQRHYDERWPLLAHLSRDGATTFISYEPALGPLTLRCNGCGHDAGAHHAPDQGGCSGWFPDWVIAGGESGPSARPMHPAWVRSLRDQCQSAGVAFFLKQWGEYGPWLDDEKFTHQAETAKRSPTFVNLDGSTGGYDADQYVQNHCGDMNEGAHIMLRVGKKHSGRAIDGRTWNEYPKPRRSW